MGSIWRFVKSFLRGCWRVLSGVSRAISVLVPLILVAYVVSVALVAVDAGKPPTVPPKAGLLINPVGVLVENRTPRRPLEALVGGDTGEVLLFDVIDAIERGADDDRITALLLDLQGLAGPSLSQTLELREAIAAFKATGKPVIAYGDYFDQSQYLLASQADRVLLHPEGALALYGFGVYRSYLKQFLDNTLITMNVFRAGDNKSAVEPYLRDDMSETERRVVDRWLNVLWDDYTGIIEQSRELEAGAVDRFVAEFVDRLEIAGGDSAQLVKDAGLVDELVGNDERNALLASVVGATDGEGEVQALDFSTYLMGTSKAFDVGDRASGPVVAIVTIEGELVPGDSNAGYAGSDTVVTQLERAAELPDLAAIVLRINSPGGSAFAADVIRDKVLTIKAAGVPIVASFASLAASGGYYIAADADRIWAQSSTITGSIGAFAAFPSVERLYEWAGISVDGVGTTELSKSVRLDTGVDDVGGRILTALITNVYTDFVTLVAKGRGMTYEQVDELAGGIVWSGRDAQRVGLVDELGGLSTAVASAAEMGGADEWRTQLIGTPIDPSQRIFEELGNRWGGVKLPASALISNFARQLSQPIRMVDSLQDPGHIYLRCLECASSL